MTGEELLRAAATRLRKLAEQATPGPWVDDESEIYSHLQGGPWVGETLKTDDWERTAADSRYIASLHPGVGLLLADVLSTAAAAFPIDHTERPRHPLDRNVLYGLLAFARDVMVEVPR